MSRGWNEANLPSPQLRSWREVWEKKLGTTFTLIASGQTHPISLGTPKRRYDMTEQDVGALILLFYGARCIFAHGVSGPTLSHGALANYKNYPPKTTPVENLFRAFYTGLVDKGRVAVVDDPMFETILTFLQSIAMLLADGTLATVFWALAWRLRGCRWMCHGGGYVKKMRMFAGFLGLWRAPEGFFEGVQHPRVTHG